MKNKIKEKKSQVGQRLCACNLSAISHNTHKLVKNSSTTLDRIMEVQALLPTFRPLLHRKPSFYRKISGCRRIKTTSELQTPRQFNGSSSTTASVPSHKVIVHDRQRGLTHEFFVPEDEYILYSAEDQNIKLPFACRHGCCTSCAVRIKSGQLRQPEALGISAELKSQGYALLCVGFPSTDLEVETQDEDEVYWLQFGRYFARGPIERDDYALELAMADE